ncbi:DNA polymerase III subunit delta [Arcanobacterium canis]|uniref:DNA-directed DNA polymerase n=1 Tax=Arcanobacterium canis TaxID=999183 RepID=A0ABY8G226_9ACTO|nr:DNA polymerase III subunit delta [Arcanobacterium canis]WFM84041.1 DNA polymerase III subunit delta [Arcanobacterium canis]
MQWNEIQPAPVILIKSEEPVFADRAWELLKRQLRERNPHTEFVRLDAAAYQPGQFLALTSPSLFGEPKCLYVPALESLDAHLQEDLSTYLDSPEPDVVVLLRHNGGARGKKILEILSSQAVPTITVPKVKTAADKATAVGDVVRAHRRQMSADAVGALVDALGSDVRELLAAVSQLLADVQGRIEEHHVHTYFAGRLEATGFNVADALVAGQTARAVGLARHAMATGTSPVAVVSALAFSLRQMAQVLGSRSSKLGVKVQMAPWQMDRAKRSVRNWSAAGIGRAIELVAAADAEVKGGSRDASFALERAIIRIGQVRKGS